MSLGQSPDGASPSPPTDRRQDDGLSFDLASGQLSLGALTVSLEPGTGNEAVLAAYVDLAGRGRGQRLTELVEVRQSDIDALAAALDLESDDLVQAIEAVLGASKAEAVRLISRLRESRLIGGIAKATATAVVAGSLVAACASGPATDAGSAPGPSTKATPSAETTDQADAPVTDEHGNEIVPGPDGVGLIPPESVDAEPVVLIPPVTVDQPGVS